MTAPRTDKGPAGSHFGTARTLEDLRVRCVIDDETRCWHIRRSNGKALTKSGCQSVYVPGHGVIGLARAAWILAHDGEPPADGRTAFRCCGSHDCCNPKHLKAWTRQEHGAWLRETGRARGNPARSVINRRGAKGRQKISDELVAWARESSQAQVDIAHALEVSRALVSHMKLGRKRQLRVANSVFAWAGVQS